MLRAALALSIAFGVSCCASKPPVGNEKGGVVMNGGSNAAAAFEAAQKHCQQYGKSARVTSVTYKDYSGDPVLFDCL